MTHTGKTLLVTCASFALCTPAHAITPSSSSANPYQGIVDRNVFALKPPPPPPAPVDNTKLTGPKITLTGITTILGKRALMRATLPKQNEPGKPPEPAKEESFMLKEGERQGEIEVLEINDKAGTVKVNNYGVVVTLDFEKDGAKIPSGPALAVPGAPPAIGTAPNTLPLGVPPKTGFNPSIPTRTLRLPNTSGTPGAISPNAAAGPGMFAGRGVQPQPQPQQPGLGPDEYNLMLEVERERTKEAVSSGALPPLPPTELTPPGSVGLPGSSHGAGNQNPSSPNPGFPSLPGSTTYPRLPQF